MLVFKLLVVRVESFGVRGGSGENLGDFVSAVFQSTPSGMQPGMVDGHRPG